MLHLPSMAKLSLVFLLYCHVHSTPCAHVLLPQFSYEFSLFSFLHFVTLYVVSSQVTHFHSMHYLMTCATFRAQVSFVLIARSFLFSSEYSVFKIKMSRVSWESVRWGVVWVKLCWDRQGEIGEVGGGWDGRIRKSKS